jgi:spore coat polysaccharide biosynthesis protein SpsF
VSGAAVVLQARMGSARLPGKVMALVGGRPIVAQSVDRLRAASGLPVILATTLDPEDDVLCAVGGELGVPVVRGAAEDVLARFVQAAEAFDLTRIVRATADNPAVDAEAPLRALAVLDRTGAAYVTESGLPVGTSVEAFTVAALRLAHDAARDPADREHVTPFLRRDRRVMSIAALAPSALRRPDIRLTVDRPDDLAFVREVFDVVGAGATRAPLAAFIAAADRVRARRLIQGAAR